MQLELKDLTKKYKNKVAVDSINYIFVPGIYGVLGANGAGKTTLIRLLCNILKASEGTISYNGKEISTLGENYRDILGYLPQNFGYYADFTAQEFLLYMSTLKGMKSKCAKKRINELLEILNLADVAHKKIKTFSGGMCQRLGIGQAMLNDPKILILDEPTSGLDPKERVSFRRILAKLAKDKIIILSTHIVSDVEDIADTIIMMKKGKFLLTGNVTEIASEIRGKVWKIVASEYELNGIENKFKIANIHQNGGIVEARVVAEQKPDMESVQVEPRLEDLYLYYFGEQNG